MRGGSSGASGVAGVVGGGGGRRVGGGEAGLFATGERRGGVWYTGSSHGHAVVILALCGGRMQFGWGRNFEEE